LLCHAVTITIHTYAQDDDDDIFHKTGLSKCNYRVLQIETTLENAATSTEL